ncbi:MAG: 50S ribosomal protein L3 [Candidatus Poribacteria bacterium]|nr:50S ribosomal protein L3 [Candidatus Poribacteria bacterium]
MSNAILGKKIGMTQVFDDSGAAIPVTVVEAGPCVIVQIKTDERDGYSAIQLGFGSRNENKVNRPEMGHFRKADVKPHRFLREVRIDNTEGLSVGSTLDASIFSPGDFVDVTGTSKGRGFTGVVKRWGFAGGNKTHGGEQDHRRPGSIGHSSWPSRVFKGKKMPGRHGAKRVTTQNLQVIQADAERSLLLIKGAVPGPPNGLLIVKKAVKQGK